MLKFNSDNIIVGEIKELLTSFNLPKYRIFTNNTEAIPTIPHTKIDTGTILHEHTGTNDQNIHMNYVDYIKDNTIQRCMKSYNNEHVPIYKWLNSGKPYYYNQNIQNYTKHLIIKNAIYDSYTHEYLGDYLRFKRDYDKLDFMGMYNCFSNRSCQSLDLSLEMYNAKSGAKITHTFSTDDSAYKIYMVPVKLFKSYTIAIDCAFGAEVCCGIYDSYYDSREKLEHLPTCTYQHFNKLNFRKPVLYTGLLNLSQDEIAEMELAQCEEALKLFIKLPINNSSSIVILEGDYRDYTANNYSIINTEYLDNEAKTCGNGKKVEYDKVKLYTPLQLLKYNTGESYPMADRLVEFLTGNMITDEDELPDDLRRVQHVVAKNEKLPIDYTAKPYYGVADGLWNSALNIYLYSYMFDDKNHIPNEVRYDVTGFVDKDVEKYFGTNVKRANRTTLTNINLYSDIYPITRADKEE